MGLLVNRGTSNLLPNHSELIQTAVPMVERPKHPCPPRHQHLQQPDHSRSLDSRHTVKHPRQSPLLQRNKTHLLPITYRLMVPPQIHLAHSVLYHRCLPRSRRLQSKIKSWTQGWRYHPQHQLLTSHTVYLPLHLLHPHFLITTNILFRSSAQEDLEGGYQACDPGVARSVLYQVASLKTDDPWVVTSLGVMARVSTLQSGPSDLARNRAWPEALW